MINGLILIGAGGYASSVIDTINITKEYEIVGFIDDFKVGEYFGKPIFGNDIRKIPNYKDYCYFVSIGNLDIRKAWFEKIKNLGLNTVNIIDQSAIISDNVKIGTGNFVGKGVIINIDTIIGDDNLINTKALIEHGCRIGSHTRISTNSTLNGDVKVEDEVYFGSSAVANGQLSIGRNSVVGSGAVVISDVEEYTTVVGVPAKVIKRKGVLV